LFLKYRASWQEVQKLAVLAHLKQFDEHGEQMVRLELELSAK
jgi:hypothetical protein